MLPELLFLCKESSLTRSSHGVHTAPEIGSVPILVGQFPGVALLCLLGLLSMLSLLSLLNLLSLLSLLPLVLEGGQAQGHQAPHP